MKLNYKVFGEGEPLIIIHGLFGMLDNWVSFAKQLAKSRIVFIVDLRNHGKTGHSDVFDYQLMVEDLLEFMEDNRISNPVLVGHSMGGKLVMHFLKEYQNLIKKAFIVDIGPEEYPDGHSTIFDAMMKLDLTSVKSRKDAEEKLLDKINSLPIVQFLLKNLGRDKSGFYWKPNLDSLYRNYDTILQGIEFDEKIDIPVVFIKGGKSKHIRKIDELSIKMNFSNAEIIILSNASHWVHADNPEQLLNIIENI